MILSIILRQGSEIEYSSSVKGDLTLSRNKSTYEMKSVSAEDSKSLEENSAKLYQIKCTPKSAASSRHLQIFLLKLLTTPSEQHETDVCSRTFSKKIVVYLNMKFYNITYVFKSHVRIILILKFSQEHFAVRLTRSMSFNAWCNVYVVRSYYSSKTS